VAAQAAVDQACLEKAQAAVDQACLEKAQVAVERQVHGQHMLLWILFCFLFSLGKFTPVFKDNLLGVI
jgi:hypothetical protein